MKTQVPKVRTGATRAALQPELGGAHGLFKRWCPEETTLYQLVQEHVPTFYAQVEQETRADLPNFVKDEFEGFLQCGILADGFLRLRCKVP